MFLLFSPHFASIGFYFLFLNRVSEGFLTEFLWFNLGVVGIQEGKWLMVSYGHISTGGFLADLEISPHPEQTSIRPRKSPKQKPQKTL